MYALLHTTNKLFINLQNMISPRLRIRFVRRIPSQMQPDQQINLQQEHHQLQLQQQQQYLYQQQQNQIFEDQLQQQQDMHQQQQQPLDGMSSPL